MPEQEYMTGFGNQFETEALPGALPAGQNSPQRCAYGLYAEQLSGTAFTAPQSANRRSWLYRIRPSVLHSRKFAPFETPSWKTAPNRDEIEHVLGRFRWDPISIPGEELSFVTGVRTMTTAGNSDARIGASTGFFFVTSSMSEEYFYDADGELLIIPQQGSLAFVTEFGRIEVSPAEICVVPRGVKFRVELIDGAARGYLCENYGAPFVLPNRGVIGANCLANPRDFKTPVAAFEDKEAPCQMIVKWGGEFYSCRLDHSPLDVVAWHGNYAPYKYDLRTFSPVGAVGFDHPDPSIFCVLTAPSGEPGVGEVDFVIFPERWHVAEHTFRPPWFHMNVMSEFMGLIFGQYDAKAEGFAPGGASLHNCMLPHGPDATTFDQAASAELTPVKLTDTLAFMFETRLPQRLTRYAATLETLQKNYDESWSGLAKRFTGRP
jgi:homogentisate 1,2-dioxygenase